MDSALHEGFGLPVLEALALRVPVCCSRIPVFKEIAGEAAAYFRPYDVGDMASVLQDTLRRADDTELRIARGYRRAARFTWHETVRKTVGVYRSAIETMRTVPERAADDRSPTGVYGP